MESLASSVSIKRPSKSRQLSTTKQSLKKFSCNIPGCGKVYDKESYLKAHCKWHTKGKKLFVCTWLFCGQRFTNSDDWQKHLKTHWGQKRYACPTCNQRLACSPNSFLP